MMLSVFLRHQWMAFRRRSSAGNSMAMHIILGIFYFLIFAEIAGLGILLPFILPELAPGKDPAIVFCSYIIYYFLIGLLVRLQFQELPSLSIQPYLALNIRRKRLLRFLNVRSLLHIINVLPFFVFIPFTIVIFVPQYGLVSSGCFLIALFALVASNHFLNMYVKRKSVSNSRWFFVLLLLIVLLKSLDYFKFLPIEKISAEVFIYLLEHPLHCIFFVAAAWLIFLLHNNYLRSHLYIEELLPEGKIKTANTFSLLNRFGDTGEMIALDLKLIVRNKRPRNLIICSAVILFYGLLFYPQYLHTGNYSMLFLFALLITGLFVSNYGQFLFAWQSSHFDGMMSYNFNVQQYIRSKFLLLSTVCSLQFIFAGLYGFMDWILLPIQLAAFLYSIGVNTFLVIYAATFNYKYLDLGKTGRMNFQGVGAIHWLQSLFISLGPALLFFLLQKFAGLWFAILLICCLGIAGLLFNQKIIGWLAAQFMLRKYKMLEGFRQR